jgi:hypothetical protein
MKNPNETRHLSNSQWCALEDEHEESRGFRCDFMVEILESESAEADVGLRLVLVLSSEGARARQHDVS